jgi:hypothetical protein
VVDDHTAGDGQQPEPRTGTSGESGQNRQGAQEGFLRQIIGHNGVGQVRHELPDVPLGRANQLFNGIPVTEAGSMGQPRHFVVGTSHDA